MTGGWRLARGILPHYGRQSTGYQSTSPDYQEVGLFGPESLTDFKSPRNGLYGPDPILSQQPGTIAKASRSGFKAFCSVSCERRWAETADVEQGGRVSDSESLSTQQSPRTTTSTPLPQTLRASSPSLTRR
jgi:hypothetical protein